MKFGTLNLKGVMTPVEFKFIPAWDLKGHEAADNYCVSGNVMNKPLSLIERSLPNKY